MKTKIILTVSLSALLSSAKAENLQDFSERLIKVRQEVETLSRDQDSAQKQRGMETDSLLQKKFELTQQVSKERLRENQLSAKIEATRKSTSPTRVASAKESELMFSWIRELKAWVHSSLPFRTQERLSQLDRLEQRLKSKEHPDNIVAEIWNFTEKEFRLTNDNAYEILNLDLVKGVQKSEVVRLGMVQLLYKTPTGETGFAKRTDSGWLLQASTESEDSEAIQRLMVRLKDQQGRGYFEVPGLNEGVTQ